LPDKEEATSAICMYQSTAGSIFLLNMPGCCTHGC
jgi:hypothetical protein